MFKTTFRFLSDLRYSCLDSDRLRPPLGAQRLQSGSDFQPLEQLLLLRHFFLDKCGVSSLDSE
jgi:hypothetical protein